MLRRFFKCLRFYYHCVGLKFLFTVEGVKVFNPGSATTTIEYLESLKD